VGGLRTVGPSTVRVPGGVCRKSRRGFRSRKPPVWLRLPGSICGNQSLIFEPGRYLCRRRAEVVSSRGIGWYLSDVHSAGLLVDPLVRIPMLGLVNHLARRDRIRGERPRRGRDDQRHCKNRPEDTFDCMWLKCHDSPPGCAAGDLRGVIGRRCVSYVTLRWSSKKCKGACACGHHR
jgi:hypothetical protein